MYIIQEDNGENGDEEDLDCIGNGRRRVVLRQYLESIKSPYYQGKIVDFSEQHREI